MKWDRDSGEISDKGFRGEFNFLSNFYPASKEIVIEHPFIKGKVMRSKYVEVLYQASKSDIEEEVDNILSRNDPRIAKSLSHKVTISPHFYSIDLNLMTRLVEAKFNNSPLLMKKLKNINGRIIEWNYWRDKKWGVDCRTCEGDNQLGLILEHIRGVRYGR